MLQNKDNTNSQEVLSKVRLEGQNNSIEIFGLIIS